jgi:hypothetical protein
MVEMVEMVEIKMRLLVYRNLIFRELVLKTDGAMTHATGGGESGNCKPLP